MRTEQCIVYCGPQELSLVIADVIRHGGTVSDSDERNEFEGAIIYCYFPEDKIAKFVEDTEEEAITLEVLKGPL